MMNPNRFLSAVLGLSLAIALAAPSLAAPSRPELLFHATFEGDSLDAVVAKGGGAPIDAKHLEWTDGVRGRAVRLTVGAHSRLSYPFPGNVAQERGTISLWAKCEWPKMRDFRMLFSNPSLPNSNLQKSRFGSHSLMLWWHRQALRCDVSDDKDSYQSCVPAGALDGRWHHYAFSWDPNGMSMYVDGRPAGRGNDSDSPMKRAIRASANGGTYYSFSHPEPFDRFYLGSRNDDWQWDGVIDEVRIYDTPLSLEQIAKLAGEFGPPPKPSKPDYATLYARNGGNPYVGAPAAAPGVIPDSDLELVDEVRLGSAEDVEKLRGAERLRTIGDLTFGKTDGVPYTQLGAKRGSRMAIRFSPPDTPDPLYVFDIDVPDDAKRTMDCIIQKAKGGSSAGGDYIMQCGVLMGDEFANTGRIQTHRVLWWRQPGEAAVVLTSTRDNAPGAVSAVRLWRVKSGKLPPMAIPADPGPTDDGWRRCLSLYFEDPAIGYDFAVPDGMSTPKSMGETIDRTIATMRFTGENLFAYPGAWYAGLIDESYTPRPHSTDFLSGWYEKFDAEGDMYIVPTLNINNMPVPPGLVTPDSMTNGALYASPIAIHDTGLPNWGKWHGSPPNFNIAHPAVQRWLVGVVDRLAEQGAPHPSFKGVCLHVTHHCLLSWGSGESGYNDYCLDAFQKATGIAVPRDPKDPLRGKAAAEWLRANPDAWKKWIDWRCQVLTKFWGAVARRLRERRPDLKLWIVTFSTCDIKRDIGVLPNFIELANHEAGLDTAMLEAAAPNIILAQCLVPADYRWRAWIDAERHKVLRTICDEKATYQLLDGASFPWVGQHDRYWESAIGRGKNGGETLSCDWLSECGWRVATINPIGDHALRVFVLPLRYHDVLGMSKGGFLIGTYGMESRLAAFARAYRSLPAVKMDEFFRSGAVVARKADFRGKTYGYVVNTDVEPATVDVSGLPAGATDCVTGKPVPSTLKLGPYEMVSFVK